MNRVAINGYGYLAASRAWLNLYQYASELVRRDPGEIEMEIEKMALEAMKSLAGGTAAK